MSEVDPQLTIARQAGPRCCSWRPASTAPTGCSSPAGRGARGRRRRPPGRRAAPRGRRVPRPASATRPSAEIGIAYGTEKKRWLEWAVRAVRARPNDGERIQVNLIPMGSLEGAQAVLAGDQRIHVWSPASALYKDVFVQEWKIKHSGDPIVREEALALTPMVFVMWEERYEAFVREVRRAVF